MIFCLFAGLSQSRKRSNSGRRVLTDVYSEQSNYASNRAILPPPSSPNIALAILGEAQEGVVLPQIKFRYEISGLSRNFEKVIASLRSAGSHPQAAFGAKKTGCSAILRGSPCRERIRFGICVYTTFFN
jgi:hypothetical protein